MSAKRTKLRLLVVAASGLIAFGAQANDTDPAQEFQTLTPAGNPIVVDGDTSEHTANKGAAWVWFGLVVSG